MAETRPCESDVPEITNATNDLLFFVDDLVAPAALKQDVAKASEGDDAIEFKYCPWEEIQEEALKVNPQAELRPWSREQQSCSQNSEIC